MKRSLRIVWAPAILVISILSSACSFSLAEDIVPPPGSTLPEIAPTQPQPVGPLYPLVPPNPADGAAIFAEKCAPCHGPTGMGDGPQASQLPNPPVPLGLPEYARQSTPARWYSQVTQGNLQKFMPPFNSLTDRQRWDVVAYALSLSTSLETVDLGAELYQANCAQCHGETGRGDGPEGGDLPVPPTDLTDQEFMASKTANDFFQAITTGISLESGEKTMPGFKDQLTDEQRWAISDHLRNLTFASLRAVTSETQATPELQVTSESPDAVPTETVEQSLPLGVVSGRIVNASGGDVPANLEVLLHAFDNMQEVFTRTSSVGLDGAFSFETVEFFPERAFIASVVYEDVIYGSDIAVVEPDSTTINLTVPIYEPTSDPSVLLADRLHIFFEQVSPDVIRVIQLFIISNLDNRTLVVGEDGQPALTFGLPEGATNLQFEDGVLGDRFVQVAGGFGDTGAIRPGSGQHQVVYAFDLPYNGKLDLELPLHIPVSAVVILVPEDGLKIKGDILQDAGVQDVQGVSYRLYNSDGLEGGTTLALTVSGRLSGSTPRLVAGTSMSLLIGLGAFSLALIAAGGWFYKRRLADRRESKRVASEIEPAISGTATPDDPDILIETIIALDDLYQAGGLPEEAYSQKRAELKAKLKDRLG